MKRIIILSIVFMFIVVPVYAADVIITLTIPDAYVARLQAAVEGSLNCTVVDENGVIIDTLNAKACLTRKIKNELIDFLNRYEEKVIKEAATEAYNAIYQDWLDNYVPIPIQ